jgi:hypothetical protein
MNKVKQENLKRGEESEKYALQNMNYWFDTTFEKNSDEYGVLDFYDYDNKIVVEHKDRSFVSWGTYPSIMIGYNKYEEARRLIRLGWRAFFCWTLRDGVYLYEVKEKLEEVIKSGICSRTDRGKLERSSVIYIPNDLCFELDDYSSYKRYIERNKNDT